MIKIFVLFLVLFNCFSAHSDTDTVTYDKFYESKKILAADGIGFEMPEEIVNMAIERVRPFALRLVTGNGYGEEVAGSLIFMNTGKDTELNLFHVDYLLNHFFSLNILNVLTPIKTRSYIGEEYISGRRIYENSISTVKLQAFKIENKISTTYTSGRKAHVFEYEPEPEAEEALKSRGEDLPFEEYDEVNKKQVISTTIELRGGELIFSKNRVYYIKEAGSNKWKVDMTTFNAFYNSSSIKNTYSVLSGKPYTIEELIKLEDRVPEWKKYLSAEEVEMTLRKLNPEQKAEQAMHLVDRLEGENQNNKALAKSDLKKVGTNGQANVFDISLARKKSCGKFFKN